MSWEGAEVQPESDELNGDSVRDYAEDGDGEAMLEDAESRSVIETIIGYSRYRDPATHTLGVLARTRDSVHKGYMATRQRVKAVPELTCRGFLGQIATGLGGIQETIDRALVKALRDHVLWEWLDAHRVRGVHVARFIGMIGNPHRFPGRKCIAGHHLPCDWTSDCPIVGGEKGEKPTVCGASVGPIRQGTGTRPMWHYFGLHADANGRAPRMRKGQQCTWDPMGRACLLQPGGIAEQIVRHRQEPWRSVYDEKKDRLQLERGVVAPCEIDGAPGVAGEEGSADFAGEIDSRCGIAASGGAVERCSEIDLEVGSLRPIEVEGSAGDRDEICPDYGTAASGGAAAAGDEIDSSSGSLRPIDIERTARKVAVKAFAADLLTMWKELDPVCRAGNAE